MSRNLDITVKLTGQDGNAFFVLGKAKAALRQGGVPLAEINAFMDEATSGDYDHLLATVMEYMEVT